ncbi:antibiotic biosynthesis monooxygenase family protein [Flavobacterium sp. 3HN19-14]|uniref:antibiotic biosynthesis monooxygenase family protein n=1 Tax=Flavobacterium sp. 3HN19-14 TaxID=3448133 RepID=UPI003EDFA4F1
MQTPYYAVIFTSTRTEADENYGETAELMVKMAAEQPGFLGVESARDEIGITVSYWKDLESIKNWKKVIEHKTAQQKGRNTWYENYTVRIALVEREYSFDKNSL